MAESILRESFTILNVMFTTLPMRECFSRFLLVFLILFALCPVVVVLDFAFGGRNSIIDGFKSVVFGFPGEVLIMIFCSWPLITEVLTWV